MVVRFAPPLPPRVPLMMSWGQQGALRPPADPVLLEAEHWFFRSLFTDPDDLEALNLGPPMR